MQYMVFFYTHVCHPYMPLYVSIIILAFITRLHKVQFFISKPRARTEFKGTWYSKVRISQLSEYLRELTSQ